MLLCNILCRAGPGELAELWGWSCLTVVAAQAPQSSSSGYLFCQTGASKGAKQRIKPVKSTSGASPRKAKLIAQRYVATAKVYAHLGGSLRQPITGTAKAGHKKA